MSLTSSSRFSFWLVFVPIIFILLASFSLQVLSLAVRLFIFFFIQLHVAFLNIIAFFFIPWLHFAIKLPSFFNYEEVIFVLFTQRAASFVLQTEVSFSQFTFHALGIFYLIRSTLLHFFPLLALVFIISTAFWAQIPLSFSNFPHAFYELFLIAFFPFTAFFSTLVFVATTNFFILPLEILLAYVVFTIESIYFSIIATAVSLTNFISEPLTFF